ncbi:MAG: Crp/Fnr family transcriptional regulator, partial [Bacteroidota bacterium]
SVKISQTSDDGREVIKRFLIPGNMFGELALLGGKVYQDNAVSLNDEVEVYQLRAHHLLNMMRDNHELTLHILKWVYERIEAMETKLEAMVLKDARARIIDFLKETANKVGRKVGFELLIKLSLTQQDIANIVGTSRQTVTTVLNELKRENLIHFNRRSILIRDISKLV